MLPFINRVLERNSVFAVACAIAFSVLAVLPLPWNDVTRDFFADQFFKVRGKRHWPENFMLVAIGPQDVQALGGWPLTRDYYGYVLHFLAHRGATVIGFDLLFDQPQTRYPEHDATISNLLSRYGNVCLPMVFSAFESSDSSPPAFASHLQQVFAGDQPIMPQPEFQRHLAGMGFGNLARTPLPRTAPVIAAYGDSMCLSFGAELARLFLQGRKAPELHRRNLVLFDSAQVAREIPLDAAGSIRLNHFGDVTDLPMIGFVELLHLSQRQPDSLNWRGKLVLVAVTDPTLTTIKATPLAQALPAGAIHLTVAENIIQQTYLREASRIAHVAAIFALVGVMAWVGRRMDFPHAIVASTLLILCYGALAWGLFASAHLIIAMFYPLLAGLAMLAGLVYTQQRRQRGWELSQRLLLQESMALKQVQLEQAGARLVEVQDELSRQASSSASSREFVETQRQKILVLEKQIRDLQAYQGDKPAAASTEFTGIVHAPESAMAEVLALVKKVAVDDIPILIHGETGTGKELVARAIHRAGPRQHKPFVAINCGALAESLLESELFGHEKGSFTGALAQRRGRFELAHGGTLFLDEITETSAAVQVRLLRVLQDGAFERVGGEQTLKTDARVIAACNRDLQKEIEAQRFRADLYYRLQGFQITLPSLRDRRQDVPLLARHFLRKYSSQKTMELSDTAMAALQYYSWPGNVRELENVVRRAAVLAQSAGRGLLQSEDLPREVLTEKSAQGAPPGYRALPEQILDMLRGLRFSRSAISQTAKALGDRDRGTITEYFRGICFEQVVQEEFEVAAAARAVAGTTDEEVVNRVRAKIEEYLENLHLLQNGLSRGNDNQALLQQACKGLPKKYHGYVQKIFAHFAEKPGMG